MPSKAGRMKWLTAPPKTMAELEAILRVKGLLWVGSGRSLRNAPLCLEKAQRRRCHCPNQPGDPNAYR